ncbi:MAG TPA: DUF488 domain-containing protein [Gemmataceae bacterium]|jgi:uncharacterized protein (DUF488 family)|nr:DUF488 domain-containing protein [Gemmataceae bacterium]
MKVDHDSREAPQISKSGLIGNQLLSVGHSNLEIARFVQLLQASRVTAIADVRSQPFSKWLPWTNRPNLEQALAEHEIHYHFLGDLLGGRPQSTEVYDLEGRVDYERVKITAAFQRGLDRMAQVLENSRLAMLCSEEDPIDCHRGLLIAPAMKERGFAAMHIRGDGSLESQADFEARLIDATGVGSGLLDGLFAASLSTEDHHQILADAYRFQSHRKAFRLTAEQKE